MKFYFLMTFIVFFTSCSGNKSSNFLKPKQSIRAILDDFANQVKCLDCFNEIFIDKETAHNFTIIIYSGSSSLTKNENYHYHQNPIQYFRSTNGLIFSIFSGVERYFDTEYVSERQDFVNTGKHDSELKKIWVVKDSFNIIKLHKDYNFAYPFLPLPKKAGKILFVRDSTEQNKGKIESNK